MKKAFNILILVPLMFTFSTFGKPATKMFDDEGNQSTIVEYVAANSGGDASSVTYGEGSVEDALDQLLYVEPVISSYRIEGLTVFPAEEGSTQSALDLTWSINSGVTLTEQTISNIGSIGSALRATTTPSATTDKTYTLSVTDGTTPKTANVYLDFRYATYSGALSSTTVGRDEMLAMTDSLSYTTQERTITYDCSGGKYPCIIYPSSWGTMAAAWVGGFRTTAITQTTGTWNNASSSSTEWRIVYVTQKSFADDLTVVWEK